MSSIQHLKELLHRLYFSLIFNGAKIRFLLNITPHI